MDCRNAARQREAGLSNRAQTRPADSRAARQTRLRFMPMPLNRFNDSTLYLSRRSRMAKAERITRRSLKPSTE